MAVKSPETRGKPPRLRDASSASASPWRCSCEGANAQRAQARVPLGALSDGQRQRVELQRRLGAVETETVVLLDEITAELDMLVRQDLLDWLVEANCTVLNVTHVFEACEGWATHLLYLQGAASHLEPLEPAATAGPWPSLFARAVERLGQDAPTPMARAALPRAVGTTAGVDIEDLRFDYGRGTVLSVEKLSLPVGQVNAAQRHGRPAHGKGPKAASTGRPSIRGAVAGPGDLHSQQRVEAPGGSDARADLQSQGFEPTSLAQRMLRLVQIFSVEPTKPLGLLSDGQSLEMRRTCFMHLHAELNAAQGGRVQLAVKLVKPARLLLMDEVTADLDVLAREALLRFLREESEDGCSVEASGASLSGAVLARLRAERERRRAEPPERAAGRPERVAHAADFGDALPLGWHRRHAEGAYGNYAWNVEAKPQEEWSFQSLRAACDEGRRRVTFEVEHSEEHGRVFLFGGCRDSKSSVTRSFGMPLVLRIRGRWISWSGGPLDRSV
eukprot:g11405.t1